MRAANSEFSIIPAEGVSGTFIKVTQRVPLRIAVTVPPELALGPGLSVEVRIHSGTSAAGPGAPGRDHD
jgi:multidrug resistance efflux pump